MNEFQGASDVNTNKTRNLITAKVEISLTTNDLPAAIPGTL